MRITFNEQMEERKNKAVLSKICKECGRYRKIPIRYCNECWKEMDETINQKEN